MNTRPLEEVRADLTAQTHRRFIKTHTPLGGLPRDEPPPDPVDRFWAWVEGDAEHEELSQLAALIHHSRTFWEVRDEPNVHLFHYADQRADLAAQMTRLAAALRVEPPTDELVDAARFESMRAKADALVPNADTPFWQSNEQFFDKARAGDWRALIGDQGLSRYEAAVRAATDDEELITWLHGGPLD